MLGLANTEIGADGLAVLVASPYLSTNCQLGLDGELLDLVPVPWIDQHVVAGASWSGHPPRELAARFRVVVEGSPRWETVERVL